MCKTSPVSSPTKLSTSRIERPSAVPAGSGTPPARLRHGSAHLARHAALLRKLIARVNRAGATGEKL
jgi:hypothetical protein